MAERVRGLLRFLSERLAAEANNLASTPRTYASTTTQDLAKNAADAAALLAQRARALHLLSPLDADPKHAAPCIVDLDKAAQTYAAHARALLAALGGPLRRLATPRAAHVLASASRLLAKMSVAEARAPDVGVLEASIESLSSVPVANADAVCELLTPIAVLLRDALVEFDLGVDAALNGWDLDVDALSQGDEQEDGEEEDEEELFGQGALTRPLRRLVELGASLVERSAAVGERGIAVDDETGLAFVASAQAASASVDSLVCAMHEDDDDAVGANVSTLLKVLRELDEALTAGGVRRSEAELATSELETCAAAALGALVPGGHASKESRRAAAAIHQGLEKMILQPQP